MNYRDGRSPTELMVVTVAELQGRSREVQAERSRRQRYDRRNTNGQRGRVQATSWRVTAKSKVHQDASGRVRRHVSKVHVLTRGDLRRESAGEVSRDRSNKEAGENQWSEGSKNQNARGTIWRKSYEESGQRGARQLRPLSNVYGKDPQYSPLLSLHDGRSF